MGCLHHLWPTVDTLHAVLSLPAAAKVFLPAGLLLKPAPRQGEVVGVLQNGGCAQKKLLAHALIFKINIGFKVTFKSPVFLVRIFIV